MTDTSIAVQDITVADFLEGKFFFEMKKYLGCDSTNLKLLKTQDPNAYRSAARHVLDNEVTSQCAWHIMDTVRVDGSGWSATTPQDPTSLLPRQIRIGHPGEGHTR